MLRSCKSQQAHWQSCQVNKKLTSNFFSNNFRIMQRTGERLFGPLTAQRMNAI